MCPESDSHEPHKTPIAGNDGPADPVADRGNGGALRKLRYDAPALEIRSPLYLHTNDADSDEEAA